MTAEGLQFLSELERLIEQRKGASPDESYTARLYAAGASRIAQKVGEEAVEVALASVVRDRPRILAESADLVYHLLVLLRFHELSLEDVARELGQRHR
jgi:phosphoribosyl-ATP pyrophosphohydrolase/phosphoribosyl-AMP cyclohydrolase